MSKISYYSSNTFNPNNPQYENPAFFDTIRDFPNRFTTDQINDKSNYWLTNFDNKTEHYDEPIQEDRKIINNKPQIVIKEKEIHRENTKTYNAIIMFLICYICLTLTLFIFYIIIKLITH